MTQIIQEVVTTTYNLINNELPFNTPIYSSEGAFNETENYFMGEYDIQQTWATIGSVDDLLTFCTKEFGEHVDDVLQVVNGKDYKIGWVFGKEVPYDDSDPDEPTKTFWQQTHVLLYVKTDNGYASLVLA